MKRTSLIGLGIAGVAGVAGAGVAGILARRTIATRGDSQAEGLPAEVRVRRLTMPDGASLRVLEAGPAASPTAASGGGDGRGDEPAGGQPQKPPIVLLHGITLGADIWHRQLADLSAAGHRVIAYDLRGHGGSDATDLTFDRLVADLNEVLQQLDLHGVVLVGHSMGGMVAIKALSSDARTATGAGRVSALGLVATSANPVTGSGVPGARVVARTLQPLLARSAWVTSRLPGPTLPKANISYALARINFGEDPVPAEIVLTQQLVSEVRAHVTGQLLMEILRFDDLAALERVNLPATVVVGTKDIVSPARHGEALAAAIGGAKLVVLEGCGHMVMLERPTELAAALDALGARIAASAAEPAAPAPPGAEPVPPVALRR